ncbi:protein tincar [Anopheles stephensi]|uniref:protein tincar n=1 Tax=Anopheles stephensi TaxID=30069 RepID=UPI0016589705|nr:protein tincar [Anopheles stephensi]XP_035896350.1 protein tincar [Anopheles stephensi]XP_035896351.1 protein tincar [Anopheles stephensi]XP_035896352.1 protein tincar [Anopheles stephensi]XP_035896353.1 protein tincar [Anopheles stephensi]XP_035896355.1 protein tincar [Anopheles stephensi]XP_035896356.1 protein tincar [Anopheles stephensi]XP_035896357.1 protein tincar [Anopheles stephensi]XP_035896358.1 protein tincar [Anopheles stephensi]
MSITGSLVGYENGGDITMVSKKNRSLLNITATSTASSKQCQSLNSSISHSSVVLTSNTSTQYVTNAGSLRRQTHAADINPGKHRRRRLHLNTLWSIWYGILMTLLQGYLIVQGTHRYIGLSALSWKYEKPTTELDIQIVFCGLVILFLPLLLASALFRVGNLANDGMKLASGTKLWHGSSSSNHDGLEEEAFEGTLRSLWIHGGPTSAFIHIITAICLLLPRLLLEAKVIENGLLPREHVWRTDLDFMVTHSDRLVVLSFMTSSPTYPNTTTARPPMSELERKLYRNGYFEQSDLVEKFSDYDDDIATLDTSDEAFRTHEALEMGTQLFAGSSSIAISTMENFNVPGENPTTLHTLPPMRNLITTTTTTNAPRLKQPVSTLGTVPNTSLERSSSRESRRRDPTRNNHHRKTSHSTTIGKGHVGGKGKSHHANHHQHGQHQQEHRNRYTEEIDTRLELEEQQELDWSLLNQPEGTPTLIEASAGGKRVSSKAKPSGTSSPTISAPPGTTRGTIAKSDSSHPKRPTTAQPISTTTTTTTTVPNVTKRVTTTTTTTNKDSDIHILKPVNIPENIIPSTPVTTNSKIIEIKPKSSTTTSTSSASGALSRAATISRKSRHSEPLSAMETFSSESLESIENIPSVDEDEFIIKDEHGMEIKPAFLIGAAPGNLTLRSMQLSGFPAMLAKIFGSPSERQFGAASAWAGVPSLEFVNLAIALAVWAVRYPSVFWHTSKSFACLFSLQMIANGADILLSFAGASVLYKLQTLGQALPLQAPALILNGTVTIALTMLALILTIASSMVLYLYGHGKLAARVRDRRMITAKQSADVWAYFAHCSSLCFVLALAVVKAPLMHDLSATYRGSLDGAVLAAALGSVIHLFLWIVLWLGLTAKRRWHFKLPPLDGGRLVGAAGASSQPLLRGNGSLRSPNGTPVNALQGGQGGGPGSGPGGGPGTGSGGEEETIYWPKIAPNSPKLKVTFNEVTSTSSELAHGPHEHGNKRHPSGGTTIRMSSITGEADDGDYATLRGPTGDLLHLGPYEHPAPSGSPPPPPPPPPQLLDDCDLLDEASNSNTLVGSANDHADDTSEEGKLLACVRDDSVTYASTRDLEPPITRTMSRETFMRSPEQLSSPLAPVTVTVHNHLENAAPGSTPRCLRRADSGMPTEALTPRSDSTSTESSTSPPDCRDAPSETSSGVHSGEERDEVVIRPRSGPYKSIIKAPPPAIQEEPFGRSTNMKMSSFNKDGTSATLPLTRGASDMHRSDYPQCSTMPLPAGYHQQQHHHYHSQASFTPPHSGSRQQIQPQHRTTLPNDVRYATSSNQFLKRLPYMKNAESPYGHLGLGAGHHTFSKLLHDPLAMPSTGVGMPVHSHSNHSTFLPPATIPEDRDSANYSMISDQDREMYINASQINGMQMQH